MLLKCRLPRRERLRESALLFMEGLSLMPVLSAKDGQPRAQSALAASPVYALRELHVEQQGDALLISGRVTSFYHKQLAQEVVRHAAEGVEVVNSIHVR